MLCQYKNVLGEPKKGIHSYRLFNIALFDVFLTIFVSFIISFIFRLHFLVVFVLLFLLGILLHYLFCVKTTINIFLFGK